MVWSGILLTIWIVLLTVWSTTYESMCTTHSNCLACFSLSRSQHPEDHDQGILRKAEEVEQEYVQKVQDLMAAQLEPKVQDLILLEPQVLLSMYTTLYWRGETTCTTVNDGFFSMVSYNYGVL